jgi:hypothetical protein
MDNGMCRAYRARRDGVNRIYEENDQFHICHIATVIQTLMAQPDELIIILLINGRDTAQ